MGSGPQFDVAALKQQTPGRWPEILSTLGGAPADVLDGKNHPCPKCGGKDRFRMIDVEAGALFCNQCFNHDNGDGIAAIMWLRGWDFQTAVVELAKHLGITPATAAHTNGRPKIVATYDYRDESSGLLYQVVRYDPKNFRQRRPKPGGGWVWSVKGTRLVPYRLPEMLAVPSSRGVLVVEGEKDVDRAASMGIVATTCAMGAGKWRPEYNEHFRGRSVYIIPDNDQPGREHAQEVAMSLHGIAKGIRVVELPGVPEKGDLSDWFDQGGTKKKLVQLVKAIPEWKPAPADKQPKVATEPKKPKSPPYVPFPTDALPGPTRDFVLEGAQAIGCDPSYIALPLLCTLAASIGATRCVQLKPGWTEPSVLWGVIIGRSGTAKSPAWLLATGILQRFQEWRLEEYPEQTRQYEQDMLLYAADLGEWKKKGRAKGEPPPEKPEEPQPTRYVVSDITVEALADRLKYSPRGLLVETDEAGAWLGSFDAYRSGRGGDLPKWLSMYRAEGLLVDRKSSGPVLVKRAAVSVTGTITPGDFTRAMCGEHKHNGLLARLLIASPPAKSKQWTDAVIAPETHKRLERLFARLLALDFVLDNNDRPASVDVQLDDEAFEQWVTFYNVHAQRQLEADDVLAATLAKLEGTAARLALVHHLVRQAADNPEVGDRIDARSMAAGIQLVEWFASEAQRVYGMFGESDKDRERRELADLVRRSGGKVKAHDLRHRGFRGDTEAVEAALNDLVQRGYGRWEYSPPGPEGGRPTQLFVLTDNSEHQNQNPSNPGENGGFGFGAGKREAENEVVEWTG